jgi:hypothetical protein
MMSIATQPQGMFCRENNDAAESLDVSVLVVTGTTEVGATAGLVTTVETFDFTATALVQALFPVLPSADVTDTMALFDPAVL